MLYRGACCSSGEQEQTIVSLACSLAVGGEGGRPCSSYGVGVEAGPGVERKGGLGGLSTPLVVVIHPKGNQS